MDANNFVGASGDGFDVYVNGKFVGHYTDRAAAESAFNTARAGGSNTPGPAGTPGTNTPPAGTTQPGAGGDVADILKLQLAAAQANQAAQIAYNNAVLDLQRQNAGHQWTYQQEQLAQAAAHDAWSKSVAESGVDTQKLLAHVQEGLATGQYNGAPTLAAQEAAGYMTPQTGAVGDLVAQGWQNAVKNGTANAQTARAIWQEAMPGMQPQQADAMAQWGHDFNATFGHPPSNADIDARLKQMGLNPQAPTLAREQMQNQNALGVLNLASQLRGPDNAFAYANTLASVPESMRQNVAALMQRSGIAYGGPSTSGLGGVLGQIGAGNINGGAPVTVGASAMGAPVAAQQTTMAGGMPTYAGPQPTAGLTVGAVPAQPAAAAGGSGGTTMNQTMGAPAQATTVGDANQMDRQTNGSGSVPTYRGPGVAGQGAAEPMHVAQYSPTDWNNTNSYTKRLLLAGQEAMGRDKDAELDQYRLSLPKYAGPAAGRIAA